MQTDETGKPREPSTTCRGKGTPKRGNKSDDEKTSVINTFAHEADVFALSKEEDKAAYVSSNDPFERMSRLPFSASSSKQSRVESATRERSADKNQHLVRIDCILLMLVI